MDNSLVAAKTNISIHHERVEIFPTISEFSNEKSFQMNKKSYKGKVSPWRCYWSWRDTLLSLDRSLIEVCWTIRIMCPEYQFTKDGNLKDKNEAFRAISPTLGQNVQGNQRLAKLCYDRVLREQPTRNDDNPVIVIERQKFRCKCQKRMKAHDRDPVNTIPVLGNLFTAKKW